MERWENLKLEGKIKTDFPSDGHKEGGLAEEGKTKVFNRPGVAGAVLQTFVMCHVSCFRC